MKQTDSRAKLLSEYLSGIKLIKYFGWEDMIIQKIMKVRNKETEFKYQ